MLQIYAKMSEKKNRNNLYITLFWTLFASPIIIITLLFVLISKGVIGYIPNFDELENPKNNLASVIITEDNQILQKYFIENRTFAVFEDLSPNLINALIATEDIRFERHSGIDARGLARVLFRTVLGGQNTGGGSTLTQQLAKNLYNTREFQAKGKIRRKLQLITFKFSEWVTAVQLERHYTKKEILLMYLNTVSFGHEAFGIRSAAQIFFDTSPDSLKLEEAAVLAGLLQAPTRYSTVVNPENAIKRRNVVLNQMHKYGFLDEDVRDSVKQLPLISGYYSQSHVSGRANHFRDFLAKTMNATQPLREEYYSYLNFQNDSIKWQTNMLYGWTNKNFKPDGSKYNIYTDGLKIYTTINFKMQEYAENAVEEHLGGLLQKEFFADRKHMRNPPFSDDLKKEDIKIIMDQAIRRTDRYRHLRALGADWDSIMQVFQVPVPMKYFTWKGDRDTIMSPMDSLKYYKHILRAGMMVMEPNTGRVKAYVGGHNYKYFKYDQVTQGKRQVGSTIKPFMYTLAMQEGHTPCDIVQNVPITFMDHDSTWTPRNSGNFDMEGKNVTLEWGLANSVNYISAWLVKRFGPQPVVDLMHKMGIKSQVDAVPSVIFGTSDIFVEELVGAYNTFSSKGFYIEPLYVTKIEDRYGNVISEFVPQQFEAISDKSAYLMIKLLQNVVNQGTAQRLRYFYNFDGELGGKTGTTQNQSDGWYVGISPKLTAGVWVGAEDRSVRFEYLGQGSGSHMALPIYGYFMQQVYADSTLGVSQEDVWEEPLNFNVNLNCPDVVKGVGVLRNNMFEEPDKF